MKKIKSKIFSILNLILKKITKNKFEIISTSNYKKLIDTSRDNAEYYKKSKQIIFTPFKRNFINKIIFVESNYTNLKFLYDSIDKKYCDYLIYKENDLDQILKILQYKIIVVNCELRFLDKALKKHQKVICVWHAFGAFKKVAKYNKSVITTDAERNYYDSFFDFLLVSSEGIKKFYIDSFNLKREQVLGWGLPQIVKYSNNNYSASKRKFLEKHNNLKNKKIYGFFPTIVNNGKFLTHWNIDFKKLSNLLNDDEVIVFKLHPFVKKHQTNFFEIKDKIIDLSNYEDILLSCPFESILTDYSSIIFEAMLLNINLNFFRNKEAEKERELYIDYLKLPGNIIDQLEKQESVEEKILLNLRNKYKDVHNYQNFLNKNINLNSKNIIKNINDFLIDQLSK